METQMEKLRIKYVAITLKPFFSQSNIKFLHQVVILLISKTFDI